MAKHNPANERIKRDYFTLLKESRGRDAATIDAVAKSLARFEAYTNARDFKLFRREQATGFKARLAEARNARTGLPLSKATLHSTLRDLKAFFDWLAFQPGFKRRIARGDATYFNLSDKDTAIARAVRVKAAPTVEQVRHVLATMPCGTVLERRDRALVAFAAITGARANALASFLLRHVDLAGGLVEQDAREVRTKSAKTFLTWFMPCCDGALEIVTDWIGELERDHLWGPGDPLFPATRIGLGASGGFEAQGLARHGWATTTPIRGVFRRAFEGAGLPYFNPHSFRDMLVRHAMALDITPEAMKAWSQNLGHAEVLTTFTSYGNVPAHRQGELIRKANDTRRTLASSDQIASLETLLSGLKAGLPPE
jgi:integrase